MRSSEDKSILICIDAENANEILEYINQDKKHKKKFNHITGLILRRLRSTDLYDKEQINDRCKGVTAMKFFKGGANDRIYCKEIHQDDKTFIVVAAKLLEKKKSQKNNQRTNNAIEKVANYDYQIIDKEQENE